MEHHKLVFWSMIKNNFDIQHHKMQETRNNCFGSKKRSTTLRQAKIYKHECWNITASYVFKTPVCGAPLLYTNFRVSAITCFWIILITHTHRSTAKNTIFGLRRPKNVQFHQNLYFENLFHVTNNSCTIHGYKRVEINKPGKPKAGNRFREAQFFFNEASIKLKATVNSTKMHWGKGNGNSDFSNIFVSFYSARIV